MADEEDENPLPPLDIGTVTKSKGGWTKHDDGD